MYTYVYTYLPIYGPIGTAFAIFSVYPFRSRSRGWIGRTPQKKKKTNTGFLSSFDLLAVQMRSMAWAASQHCSHAIMHGEPEPWHKWITIFMLCQRKNALGFGIWPRRSRLLWLLCASLAAGSVRGMIWHLRGRARSSGAHRLEVRWAAERMKWQWIIKYEARESSTKLSYL